MTNIFTTRDTNHVVVPWREDLANLIPHAKELEWRGERMLVMPNDHVEARLARNLGVPVPAPILTRYDWNGWTPWDAQKTTAAMLTENERAYVLSEMGTGKTKSALWAADYLLKTRQAKRVLIAAPLSTLNMVWGSEIFHTLTGSEVRVLHGDRAKRLRLLAEDAQWFVVNHHGLVVLKKELIDREFDVVIIDELAVFRNKSTELWKAANAVVSAPATKFAWGMTGSPTPTAPTDAWAQVRLLTPSRTVRTMSQFRDITMRKVSDFRWAPRANATETVHAAMQPAIRFSRDSVMELPETTFVDRAVVPDLEAAKAYRLLEDKMRTLTNAGESVTAANEGILHNKLLQVACGYLYTDRGTVYVLPNSQRLKALEETIAETDRKVIVFVPYVAGLQGITDHLRQCGHSVELVYGATSSGARDKIFRAFQEDIEPRILVAHPACMQHGLTLTSANTIVWWGPPQSLETYDQACARITRPGQTSKTLIVHLIGHRVERLTYSRLKSRSKSQNFLLELFRDQEIEL